MHETTRLPAVAPPRDEAELRARLSALSGRALGELAARLGVAVPEETRRGKGFAGTLLEKLLGATAGSRAEPDFPQLGIELKTIPIDARGKPLESTFVASLELAGFDRRWETSAVRKKLARVAWVIVEGRREVPLAGRRVGAALLWSPSPGEESRLRRDYEELSELAAEGFLDRITGHRGEALQLRPKGRDASHLRAALDEEGAEVRAPPRAFYLRAAFTESLLRQYFQF